MDIQTLRQVKNDFLSDMQHAASARQTSLPFIQYHLGKTSFVQSGNIFQVLVIGGTNYQKALVQKVGDKFRIIDRDQKTQSRFTTKMDLMTFIETHTHPDAEVIALNFAYPLTPTLRDDLLDGVLQSGSKENTFDGLVGANVGEEIEIYMKRTHGRDLRVAVANDVICLLLAGLTNHKRDVIAAGIVGTGLNFAIFLDSDTIVNIESANFSHFPQSEAGREIDRLSASPGVALYEKEVSGAYLYQHFNILAHKRGLPIQTIASSDELDLLVRHETREIADLAREVLDHSASLVAAQIAGILEFSKRDLTFIMQGSLFWRGDGYRESAEHLVAELVPDYSASYEQILDSELIGAAKLVAQ